MASKSDRQERGLFRAREAAHFRAEGLTFREASERLGVTPKRGQQLIKRFQLRHWRFGRGFRYDPHICCCCPVCCKGSFVVETVNEDTRVAFEGRHPEIAEARALLVPDPEPR